MANYRLGKLKNGWCVTWKEGAKRHRHRLGVGIREPKATAEAALNEFVRAREAALLVQSGPLTVAGIFAAYIESVRKAGKSTKRQQWTWSVLEATFGALKPEDLEASRMVGGESLTICHQYAVDEDKRGKSRATIWDRLTTLRTAMNWATKSGLIARAPRVWAPSKGGPRDIVADEDEIQKIIEHSITPHIRLFVILAAGTGARKSAILQLTWDRVDFERRMIDYRAPRARSILDMKGQKGRAVVEFAGVIELALREAKELARSNFVIEFNGRQVLDIKKGLAASVRRAGLTHRKIGAHVIRHSVATWLADESVDMRMIQKLLGHADINTTQKVYAKYRRGYLTGAANVIDLKLKGTR